MKCIVTLILMSFFTTLAYAQQTRYIIKFKNKATNPFTIANPSAYLSPKALLRRQKYTIGIDSTDLPVTPRYIDSVRLAGNVTILNSSKWLNQLTIQTTDATALAKINNFAFVQYTTAVAARIGYDGLPINKKLDTATNEIAISPYQRSTVVAGSHGDVAAYGRASGQIRLHQGEFLHEHGFKGQGMQIAMLDGGYYHYLTLPTFDSIRANNQIKNVWDFVANQSSVDEDDSHGMSCFSTIAANMPDLFVGTAPKAAYCLYRTEDVATETNIEEHNLAAGFEKADSIGVDVCSVSLGYSRFDYANQNYTYQNMNGNTSMSAIAADIAAQKGMLPVIACGNEGNTAWRYVTSPGDADSVLTVGAVDTLGTVASFTSYGPSSSGQIKPNIAATGLRAVVANANTGLPVLGNGTSFATPNIAGLATCLWQAYPEVNNMTIIDALQKAGTRATNPNDRVGYGIPDIKKAFVLLMAKGYKQNICVAKNKAQVNLALKLDNTMSVTIERKLPSQNTYLVQKIINGQGAFAEQAINYSEDFVALQGITASYKVKVTIGSDTSFYIANFDINQYQTCTPTIDEINIYPNPAIDFTVVSIGRKNNTAIQINITNTLGQTVYTQAYAHVAGTQAKLIPIKSISKGIYFVSIFADGKKIKTIKLLKG